MSIKAGKSKTKGSGKWVTLVNFTKENGGGMPITELLSSMDVVQPGTDIFNRDRRN